MIGPIKGEKKIYSQAKKNQFNYQWFQIEFDFEFNLMHKKQAIPLKIYLTY